MDNKNNTNKTTPLPTNLFDKQMKEAKSGFQIKIIHKGETEKTSKEKK